MNSSYFRLKRRIAAKKASIAVVGLGYVGLPLAVEFAKKGFQVTGIDLDKERVERIRKKISYITDVSAIDLKRVIGLKKFEAEGSFLALREADVVFVCVPTPLKRKASPDISFILGAMKEIRKYLHAGQLIILESTTYPGTTEEEILPLLEVSGFSCGKDFFLAFSPERIDPGNENYPLEKIPKVIGGITGEATDLAGMLYKNIVGKVVPVSSARVAETVKLLENTFRIVNIGLIDEIAQMAHKMNINIWEVIDAASTKPFGFMSFYPGPGVGGHCIPKDPLYLYWKAKKFGFRSRF
ncbi:MAG: nucleotide sugar dehydrogenase, partial [Candidatus Omnitrophica bacterium]|nr:nucleotide sugar dehydrogenase [Candidatus Omnitrophota bacterium]